MDTLLLTLSCVFGLCALYGFIRFIILTRDFNHRRRAFDHRVDGRSAERRREQRRAQTRSAIFMA